MSLFAPVDVEVEERADGTCIVRSRRPLGPHEGSVGEVLRQRVAEVPDRTLVAERQGTGWRRVSYAEALAAAEAIGQSLLDRGLGPERPVAILSANSVDHLLVTLGGLLARVPVAPISVAYSTMADLGKLRAVLDVLRPGLVWAEQEGPLRRALDGLDGTQDWLVGLGDLLGTAPGSIRDVEVDPDDVAKVQFTSGSTGHPKGVVLTHRMWRANQTQLAAIWPFTAETPPVLVDWLPWSHTFGGNHNVGLVLAQAGTLYVDTGRPAPGLLDATIANLREVSPTISFNVPAGYGALLPHLERDPSFAEAFFRRLQLVFYAGAALPQDLWERLEAVSRRTLGRVVPMTSSWGSTETAPLATAAHFPLDRAGNVGVPVPGVELKLVPSGTKLEVRVRGPNVTPGYWRAPELTAAAFDEEGFYRIGDAMRPADPADWGKGLLFDGRVAEDFKLTTGTWVSAGRLRVEAVAAATPHVQDAVVTGADRPWVGLLVWLTGADALGTREAVVRGLRAHNDRHAGASSQRIRRALILAEPPRMDAGEITDKGYVNQRATLDRRAADVARLYVEPPDPEVLVVEER